MRVLAFDTTGPILTVGAAENSRPIGRLDAPAGRRRGNMIDSMIDSLLREIGWSRGDVEGLSLLTGPGSLTAARIGWATASGWSQAAGIPVTGWTVPVAHQRYRGSDANGVTCCIHYRADTFLLFDLGHSISEAQPIQLTGRSTSSKSPRFFTGPGVIDHRDSWSEYWGVSTEIAGDEDAMIGADTLAVWAEADIAKGIVLSTDHSPLEYGLPPDFKKLPTA